jgi:hypothetical protein
MMTGLARRLHSLRYRGRSTPADVWDARVLASLLGGPALTLLFTLRQHASAAPLIAGHLAGLTPTARTAGAASIAGPHAIAARQPGPAGSLLTRTADTAYAHGITHAAAVGASLLVICAIFCAALLPGRPAKAVAPDTGPQYR